MCRRAEIELAAQQHAAGQARRWVARVLRDCYGDAGALLDDAALVVSELVTNALQSGTNTLRLTIEAHGRRATVCVTDDVAALPVRRTSAVADVHGRGLAIIEKVALSWGTRRAPSTKTVWADLGVPAVARATFKCREA